FNAQENRFDMFDAIQRGKTVIVNVPFALLTSAGAELFGRYMIASTLAASFERVTIRDKSKWRPAFLYIEESQEFADENKTPELLRLAREYKLGVPLPARPRTARKRLAQIGSPHQHPHKIRKLSRSRRKCDG